MKPIYVCNIFLPPFSFKTIYTITYYKRILTVLKNFAKKLNILTITTQSFRNPLSTMMNLGWIEMILDDVEGAINQLLSRRLELLREEDDLTIYQKKT